MQQSWVIELYCIEYLLVYCDVLVAILCSSAKTLRTSCRSPHHPSRDTEKASVEGGSFRHSKKRRNTLNGS